MTTYRITALTAACLTVLATAMLLPAQYGYSQDLGTLGTELFSIALTPTYPAPRSTVTASIESYRFERDRANITWTIGGKTVAQGLGIKTVSFQSPDVGQSMQISAFVTTDTGESAGKTLNLTVNDIDFLWDALTYIPPGYRGRALPTVQSNVRVAAVPHLFLGGKTLPPETLIYEWMFDFEKDMTASGAGRDSFIFNLPDKSNHNVTLRLSNAAGDVTFEKNFTISARNTDPEIILYQDDPLEGPDYARALSGNAELKTTELGLRAEPFYFSLDNLKNLTYAWRMNNEPVATEEAPNVLRVRAPENTSGASILTLSIRNLAKLQQSANATLNIIFGK